MAPEKAFIRRSIKVGRSPWSWLAVAFAYLFSDPFYESAFGAKTMSAALAEMLSNVGAFVSNPLVRFLMLPLVVLCFWKASVSVAKTEAKETRKTKDIVEGQNKLIKNLAEKNETLISIPIISVYLETFDQEIDRMLRHADEMESYLRTYDIEVSLLVEQERTVINRSVPRLPKIDSSRGQLHGLTLLEIPEWIPAWEFQDPILNSETSEYGETNDVFRPSANAPYIRSLAHNRQVFNLRIKDIREYATKKSAEIFQQRKALKEKITILWNKIEQTDLTAF